MEHNDEKRKKKNPKRLNLCGRLPLLCLVRYSSFTHHHDKTLTSLRLHLDSPDPSSLSLSHTQDGRRCPSALLYAKPLINAPIHGGMKLLHTKRVHTHLTTQKYHGISYHSSYIIDYDYRKAPPLPPSPRPTVSTLMSVRTLISSSGPVLARVGLIQPLVGLVRLTWCRICPAAGAEAGCCSSGAPRVWV